MPRGRPFPKGKSANPDGRARIYPKRLPRNLKQYIRNDRAGLGLDVQKRIGFNASPQRITELKKRVRAIARIDIEDQATVERYKQIILLAVADGVSWMTACQILGISAAIYHGWRAADADFAAMLLEANACSVARLKDKAYQMALEGNTTIMQTLLVAYDPENFARTKSESAQAINDGVLGILRAVGKTLDARSPRQIEHEPAHVGAES